MTYLTISDVEALKPVSLAEAKCHLDWLRWKEAMDKEMKALEAYKTWELDDSPPGANLVGCHWVYALKKDAAGHIIHSAESFNAMDLIISSQSLPP